MRSWTKLCGVMGGVAGLMGVLASQAAASAPSYAASTTLATSSSFIHAPEPFLIVVLLAGLVVSFLGLRTLKPATVHQKSSRRQGH